MGYVELGGEAGAGMMGFRLETERLILDELAVDRDELFIFELLNEPGFLENIGDRGVNDLAGATGYIQKGPAASYAKHGFGLWRVVDRSAGQPVGICGLLQRETLADPDVGYAILERYAGRGYAQEAAQACVDYGRSNLSMGKIVAITTPDNKASQRVLEKIGFRFDSVIELPGHGGESAYFVSEG
jgi:[ribosomal protein S5]-alanine N-acetyltransferase